MQQYDRIRRRKGGAHDNYSIYDHVRSIQNNDGSTFYDELRRTKGLQSLSAPNLTAAQSLNKHKQSQTSLGRKRGQRESVSLHNGFGTRASNNTTQNRLTQSQVVDLDSHNERRRSQNTPRRSVFDVERPPLPPITATTDSRGKAKELSPRGPPGLQQSEAEPQRVGSRGSSVCSASLPPTRAADRDPPGSPLRRPPSFRSGGYFIDSLGNLRESRTDFVKSEFDVKNDELHSIKKSAQHQMNKFSAIKMDYITWFKSKHERFINAVKHTQAAIPNLVPQVLTTIHQVRILNEACRTLFERTNNRMYAFEEIHNFLELFDRIVSIYRDTTLAVYLPLCSYCDSISTLRIPKIKNNIDSVEDRLALELSEEFNFEFVHNEKENLFAYRVGVFDNKYLGLVHYIPYLLRQAIEMCYLVHNVYLEKE